MQEYPSLWGNISFVCWGDADSDPASHHQGIHLPPKYLGTPMEKFGLRDAGQDRVEKLRSKEFA